MKKSKNFILRYISLTIVHAMMIMTFILAPIPGVKHSSMVAYADESVDESGSTTVGCDEDNHTSSNGGLGVYQAGCKFNEDMATTGDSDHYADGTEGIIEQFVGAAFALIGLMLFWNGKMNLNTECVSNAGGIVTYPIIQVGSLAYILGEIAANKKFKEASKITVDSTFGAKKDENYDKSGNKEERQKSQKKANERRAENNDQIKAYDALEKVYQSQVDGLQKKLIGATLAEAAFVSATGIEISNIMGMTATCTTGLTNASTIDKTYRTNLSGTITGSLTTAATTSLAQAEAYTIEAEAAASSVVGSGGAPALFALAKKSYAEANSCKLTNFELRSYLAELIAQDAGAKASNIAEDVEKTASLTEDMGSLIGNFAVQVATMAGVTPSKLKAVREAAQNHANALKNDAADIGYKGTRTTLQASILGTSSLCTSVSAVVNDHIAAIEANRNVPIPCCGVLTEKGATLDSVSFGKIPNQDQVADASAANSIVDINKNHKYYVKVIIENVLRKIAMQKINKMQISTPVEKIRKIASIDSYINYIVENQSALFEKENIQKEIKKLHDRNDIKDKNIENYFLSTISKLKKEMLVDSANAGDDFKELLKLGVKLLLLYYTMGSWLKENALPKPSTRAWTWGIMSVVNAAIIKFDTDSKKEAESRVATVQAEREAFVKSHANNSVYGNKNAKDKGEYELGQVEMGQQKRGKNGLIGCAVPKGNGFAPTECPSVIPRQRFNFPQAKRTNVSGSLTGQALGMIGNMSHAAASNGMIDSDDSFSAGKIDKLSAVTSALRKRNDKLIKKYDDLTNKRDKSLKKKSLPLSKSMAKFKTLFTGNPKKTGVSKAQMAAGSNLVLPKLEKLKKKQAKLAKIKPINIPKFESAGIASGAGDFDFGMDDGVAGSDAPIIEGGEAKAGEKLEEFVIDAGEINDNQHVNIFKLISNRYLHSYSTLLDEAKPASK